MNSLPLVDVVIPVYHRDNQLLQCVESVFYQTYPFINLCVIEDGSNLAGRHIPRTCNKKFGKPVQYIRLNKNRGVSYCRNLGAWFCKGKYLAFLDSDDLWAPTKIEKQVKFLENQPQYKWVHTNELWIKNGTVISQKKEHKKQEGIFVQRLLDRCLISPSSVFFLRDFFCANSGFNINFKVAEDFELWLRLNVKNPIGYIEEPLTIKQAGNWEQLSSTREIDRWRVLALHRIYHMFKNDPEFETYIPECKFQLIKKTKILIKGAEKYKHEKKIIQYQNWLKVFNTF